MDATLKNELRNLLDELESSQLEVILVPQRHRTNEGGMIRVAASKNVKWYQDLCARFPSSRRRKNSASDTKIKRQDIIKVLKNLTETGHSPSIYAPTLTSIAKNRARNLGIAV